MQIAGDGHSSEGDKIVPMTRIEVLCWFEQHNAQEEIDRHFCDLVEEA